MAPRNDGHTIRTASTPQGNGNSGRAAKQPWRINTGRGITKQGGMGGHDTKRTSR